MLGEAGGNSVEVHERLSDLCGVGWCAMKVDLPDTIRRILQSCAAPVDRCTMPCTSAKSNATFTEKSPTYSPQALLVSDSGYLQVANGRSSLKLRYLVLAETSCLVTLVHSSSSTPRDGQVQGQPLLRAAGF
jgi:hypothetical protein